MRELANTTLIGVDCVDIARLLHAATICQRALRFGAVRMLSSLDTGHPWVVPIEHISSIEAYSAWMIKQLDLYVATPFALVIQYDGFVLNPDAWRDAYLAYDYIGAPWWHEEQSIVGNGGFSLRSKRLLTLLRQDETISVPADVAEDWYICVVLRSYLEAQGMRFAPVELAEEFSLEGNTHVGVTWTKQFGFHGLSWTDISRWLQQHPDPLIDNTLDSETLALKQREKL